jgi:hypothetical protein
VYFVHCRQTGPCPEDKITDSQVSIGGPGENKMPNWFIVTENNEFYYINNNAFTALLVNKYQICPLYKL